MGHFSRTLCTYRVTESRRIKIFAIGLKIMKIQNLLSRNNTTAMLCEQYPRRQIDITIFFKKSIYSLTNSVKLLMFLEDSEITLCDDR